MHKCRGESGHHPVTFIHKENKSPKSCPNPNLLYKTHFPHKQINPQKQFLNSITRRKIKKLAGKSRNLPGNQETWIYLCFISTRGMDLINFEATELRLGLPEIKLTTSPVNTNKRSAPEMEYSSRSPPPTKAQVVGWPPVRSYRKNILQGKKSEPEMGSGMYVKVSMDGAPYLRKVDLKVYKSYGELLKGLEEMFKCIIGLYSEREGYKSEYAPTYEDKDGDWMLLGDVPWDMFLTSCRRLRIMKSCDVIES
ncbi:hypothetical protein L1987_50525 [Smallanthus sonchifolius]|uniref:Uncharacterized protein n=1 Tax=Smallanthus sonchifolius TaxID=185202 RepID=A0ACB9EN38_9ASTR|nr:hypothetical protein L1987_50525 [Smallanthus sonchifolius]